MHVLQKATKLPVYKIPNNLLVRMKHSNEIYRVLALTLREIPVVKKQTWFPSEHNCTIGGVLSIFLGILDVLSIYLVLFVWVIG